MTKMTRIPIAAATDDQLREFCDVQQLELENITRSGMLATLSAVWGHDFILASGDDASDQTEAATPQPRQALPPGVANNAPIWLIEISETEMMGGKDPVQVSVNGKALILQRNMHIPLPHPYKVALDNAVRESGEQTTKADGHPGEIHFSRVRAYPYQVLQAPTAEEIAAYTARVGGIELGVHALQSA